MDKIVLLCALSLAHLLTVASFDRTFSGHAATQLHSNVDPDGCVPPTINEERIMRHQALILKHVCLEQVKGGGGNSESDAWRTSQPRAGEGGERGTQNLMHQLQHRPHIQHTTRAE